ATPLGGGFPPALGLVPSRGGATACGPEARPGAPPPGTPLHRGLVDHAQVRHAGVHSFADQGSASVQGHPVMRAWWLSVVIITLAAFALRLALIVQQSFYYDEVVTVWLSEHSYWEMLTGHVLAVDLGNPPLYTIVVRAFAALFGRSEV